MNRIILAVIMSLLCVSTAHSKVTYLHSNPQGSIVAATDETGNQLWVKRYTPYGTESEAAGTVSDSGANHGYATHEVDKETGLVYMKARYYDPAVGRFYSTDPVSFQESQTWSFNPFLYAANAPFTFIDPLGLTVEIGSVPVIPFVAQHAGVIVTPSFPTEILISRPDLYFTLSLSQGSIALDAHNVGGYLSPRGYDPGYLWGNTQALHPSNQADKYIFNGSAINLSADSASIINMLDAYSYLNIDSNKQPYNGWCCGNNNSWFDNKLQSIYPAFYDGGWNSNNFATSILDSGGIYSNPSMLPNSPGFGTPLPNLNW